MDRCIRASICALLVVAAACAGDVDLVDRTQPGKLKKQALAGEWYYRQTVVGVPFTAGITFVGEQSLLERVSWEISEEFLTAYRTYERVQGAERPSVLPGTAYQGAPVAAFKILKHFDVVREYNTETGEQTNVLTENDTDRPWYERRYLRVDWSQNLLANFDFLAGGATGLGVVAQPASYVVTDPNDPDAPVFGVRRGDGWQDTRSPQRWGELDRIDYFDLTLKLQATPETFLLWYEDGTTEQWPACWFYEFGPWDCASSTIKVRSSFLRVPESDYVPLYYPDNYIARDAAGQAIRVTWDEAVGMRRCTADEGPGCTPVRIPMFDWFGYFRTEREAYDRDYELTEEGRVLLINRFNIWQRSRDAAGTVIPPALRQPKTIRYHLSERSPAALFPSARRVGEAWSQALAATVHSLTGVAPAAPLFEVVPNTFRADEDGIADFGQRNGDLRYNHLFWVDEPQMESLLGYGPSAADPLSGEIIAADAYAYGAAIDSYVAQAADIVDLMRGDILETEFIAGENVGHLVAALGNRAGIDPAERRAAADRAMRDGVGARLTTLRQTDRHHLRVPSDAASARLRLADAAPQADRLWTREMELAYERQVGRRLPPSQRGPRLLRALRQHRLELGRRAVCLRGFDDAAVLGVVDKLQGKTRPEVVATLREWLFESTAIHEVGHTLGLRHNFAASADALNYFDQYWAIRDPTARALDLPSRDEMSAGVRELAYASIMDYGAKFMSDIHGLGKYDVAAIKFGYGQLIEAFVTPPDWMEHDLLAYYTLDDAVEHWSHYTALPALFDTTAGSGDGRANIAARADVPMSEVVSWMTLAPGATDLTDTLVPYKFCSDEYVGVAWDCDVWDEGADPYEIVSYATQSYRDYYVFRAFRRHRRYVDPFDYYLSTWERFMLPVKQQYYLWLYDQWSAWGEWAWLHGEDVANGTQITEVEDWNLDPRGGLNRTVAAMEGMNFLTEIIATPEPGSYYTDPDTGTLLWWTDEEDVLCGPGQSSWTEPCSDIYVPLGAGRYAYTAFDPDDGYYFYEKVRVVGSFWDKLNAIETLADPSAYFLGVDDVGDFTTYMLGFNVAFPNAVSTIFGAVINDDYKKFAPQLEPDQTMSWRPIFDTVSEAYTDQVAPDRPGPFIDPATNWTIAIYALFYGTAWLTMSFDQSFNDYAKIWLDGSGEAFTPAAGAEVATFTNPFNDRVYKAVKAPTPNTYSLGWEMVTRAQGLADRITTHVDPTCDIVATDDACAGLRWELQNLIENIELLRGYYEVFGYSWW